VPFAALVHRSYIFYSPECVDCVVNNNNSFVYMQVSENPRYKKPEQKVVRGIHGFARSVHQRAHGLCRMADQVLGM